MEKEQECKKIDLASELEKLINNKPSKQNPIRSFSENLLLLLTKKDKASEKAESDFLRKWSDWKRDLNFLWKKIIASRYEGENLWNTITDPKVFKEVWEQVDFLPQEKSHLFEYSQRFAVFCKTASTKEKSMWSPRISFTKNYEP